MESREEEMDDDHDEDAVETVEPKEKKNQQPNGHLIKLQFFLQLSLPLPPRLYSTSSCLILKFALDVGSCRLKQYRTELSCRI